jgi:protein-tyrosine phosphatase
VIDIHSHILPGLDDGSQTWEESLKMARMAVDDGIRLMAATPHLYQSKVVDHQKLNKKEVILDHIQQFKEKLAEEEIDLEIVPGCDIPLCLEFLQLLDDDQVLTINDGKRYLLLELPDTSFPPATEEICFFLKSKGVTPIITHPERQFIIQEMPEKLTRLLELGCLAQLTAHSLLGGFGRRVARFARQLVKKGHIHLLATDAHNAKSRPPLLRKAVEELTRLVGEERARAMVTSIPQRIVRGEPCF